MPQCYITTLTPTCCYQTGQRWLQAVQRPRAVVAVSLQGSHYYIHRCICCCAPRASRSASSTRWAAPSAAGPIIRLLPACCSGGGAAGTTPDSHLHPRLRGLVGVVAAAALRSRRSACTDKNLVGKCLHKQGKLSIDIIFVIHEKNK